jgi:hypothetical protein
VKQVIETITDSDSTGWFKHSGYACMSSAIALATCSAFPADYRFSLP